jgi:hypothetical protein
MAKSSFDAIKSRFSAQSGNANTNNYYPFFKMPDDAQARIRFLPDGNEDNPLGFLVEKLTHSLKVNGENKTVPCLTPHGEECPVCKVAKDYYDRDDKVNGKLYYKKRTYLAQALVVEDPIVDGKHENCEGKVKLISIGYSLFKIIKDAFESGELDDAPFAYEGGTDFLIKKTKQGEFASYTLSKFARKSTDLDAEQQEHVKAGLVDLSTLLPKKPDVKFVENVLEAALTGKSIKGEDDETDEDDMGAFAKMKAKAAAKPAKADSDDEDEEFVKPVKAEAAKPAPKAAPAADMDEDDEAEALLAQLKAKREAAKRAAAGSDD